MKRRLKLDDYTLEEHEANIYVCCAIRTIAPDIDHFSQLMLDEPFFQQWARDNIDWLYATMGEWPAAAVNQRSPMLLTKVHTRT